MSAETALTKSGPVLITIRSKKSFFEVTEVTEPIEASLQRLSVRTLIEYVGRGDGEGWIGAIRRRGLGTEQVLKLLGNGPGPGMRLAGIPIESRFYLVGNTFILVGNAVIARDLFRYTAAAGLGAPVRICVSRRDGETTRIDLDQLTAFFSQFPETGPSDVARLLDTEMVKVFEDAA